MLTSEVAESEAREAHSAKDQVLPLLLQLNPA